MGFILVAAAFGYHAGGWNAATLQSTGLSAAQAVALRFPEDWNDGLDGALAEPKSDRLSSAAVWGDLQFVLLNPEPMIRPVVRQSTAEITSPQPAAPAKTAAEGTAVPVSPASASPRSSAIAAAPVETRPAAAAARHHASRPGFVLDDAQIASIKQRLHLTPDQEQMWPAVEAALRNVAYARSREAHRHNAPKAAAQLAAVDPNSAEVQGLKSAAFPLILSFSAEQKSEVRSLAHVMGLDQLASQF